MNDAAMGRVIALPTPRHDDPDDEPQDAVPDWATPSASTATSTDTSTPSAEASTGRLDLDPAPQVLTGELLPADPRSVLPAWLLSRDALRARAVEAAEAAGRAAARHGLRAPVYGLQVLWSAGRGAGRVLRRVAVWVGAPEHRAVIDAAQRELDAAPEGQGRVAAERVVEARKRWRAERDARARVVRTVVIAGVFGGGLVVWLAPAVVTAGAVVGGVAALAFVGRNPGGRRAVAAGEWSADGLDGGPTLDGAGAGAVAATLAEALAETRTAAVVHRVRPAGYGWTVDLVLTAGTSADVADRLDDIEARMRTRRGALSMSTDPGDAGRITLRIATADPWANLPAVPERAPLSLSVRDRHAIATTIDGDRASVSLLRVHAAFVGGTGAGKSSLIWDALDILTACRDAVVWGVDLTGGPALSAWGECVQRYATTKATAAELLTAAVREAIRRASLLGERCRPVPGRPAPESEDWQPTPEDPQLTIVIDEFPVLVDAGLGDLVKTLLRIGRKAAVTVIIGSQRATADDLGSTTVRAMLGIRALLPCVPTDIDALMGPGSRAEGWRPDRLLPADGEDPRDAGTLYLRAGGHIVPRPMRADRLTPPGVHARAVERIAAGLPVLDLDDTVPADLDDDARVLADVLNVIGPQARGAWTADILARLADADPDTYGGWTPEDLSAALLPHGVKPRQIELTDASGTRRNRNGYRRDDVQTALDAALADA